MAKNETTQKTHATNQTNPWAPTMPALSEMISRIGGQIPNASVTGDETASLNALAARAKEGNPWAGNIGALTDDLFAGGPDRTGIISNAYSQFQSNLNPVASTDYTDPTKNAGMKSWLDTVTGDVSNTVNSQFASAGRTMSPAHAQALARGVVQGTAPIYGEMEGRRLGAIRDLFTGATTAGASLAGMDQTALANRAAGINVGQQALAARDAGDNAVLAIAQRMRDLPLNNLGALSKMLLPYAQLGGTSETDQITNTERPDNTLQTIVGGALGGLALLGGNPMPLLGLGASTALGNPNTGTGWYGSPQFGAAQRNPASWIPGPWA